MVKDPEASFRELFGEEFARAYEEQLRQLKARTGAPDEVPEDAATLRYLSSARPPRPSSAAVDSFGGLIRVRGRMTSFVIDCVAHTGIHTL